MILGRVVDGVDGSAIADATVRIAAVDVPASPQVTDSDGRFVFFDLPAGSYRLLVSKNGWLPGEYGQSRAGDDDVPLSGPAGAEHALFQRIALKPGERRGDLKVLLWRLGAISGTVRDDLGDPAVGITVQAWPRGLNAGRPSFDGATAYSARTDDHGSYRISHLAPGGYVIEVPSTSLTVPGAFGAPHGPNTWNIDVAALLVRLGEDIAHGFPTPGTATSLDDGAWRRSRLALPDSMVSEQGSRGYRPTFYPDAASSADAVVVSTRAGEERSGVDIALRLERMFSVAGRVVSNGEQGRPVAVNLSSPTLSGADETPLAVSVANGNGEFLFPAVATGAYRLTVVEFPPGPRGFGFSVRSFAAGRAGRLEFETLPLGSLPTLCADQPLDVGAGNVAGLVLTLHGGARLSGRVEFRGRTPPPRAPSDVHLDMERADGVAFDPSPRNSVGIDAGWRFQSVQFPPGRYFLRSGLAPVGWTLESAVLSDRDLSVDAVELGSDDTSGIEVVFTDVPTQLSGTVRGGAGVAENGAAVVVFPAERRLWTDYGANPRNLRVVRVDPSGRYVVTGLPAAEYLVAAVDEGRLADWPAPAYLARLAGTASETRLTSGQGLTLDLRLTQPPPSLSSMDPYALISFWRE